jgi:hypothetical protein
LRRLFCYYNVLLSINLKWFGIIGKLAKPTKSS